MSEHELRKAEPGGAGFGHGGLTKEEAQELAQKFADKTNEEMYAYYSDDNGWWVERTNLGEYRATGHDMNQFKKALMFKPKSYRYWHEVDPFDPPEKAKNWEGGKEINLMQYKPNPYNDSLDKYPRISDMVSTINKMSVREMRESTEIEKIPLPARQSLMVFLRDWRIDDPGHERFTKFIPEGFPVQEALMMGDLLSFSMVEGEERKQANKDQYIRWKRWQDELQPFYKKIPKDLSITDLIGLHCKLLNMLPQRNYSQYTITQLFYEDETMLSSLVGEKVKISPVEFEALTMLTRLVEKGAIEQFKLAMTRSSSSSLVQMAQNKGVDIGSMILDAFKTAQQAAQYFQTGDFNMAIAKMDQLNSNYEIGPNSFAEGLDHMFVATLSAVMNTGDNFVNLKGDNQQVLMSLDISFEPQGFPNADGYDGSGFKHSAESASYRVRQAASMPTVKAGGKRKGEYKEANFAGQYGTFGVRTICEKNSGIGAQSTDWFALFAAAVCNNDKSEGEKNKKLKDNWLKNNNSVRNFVFGNDGKGRPILRFVVHGYLKDGMDDLLPKGLLTVALGATGWNEEKNTIWGKGEGAIPRFSVDMFYQDFDKLGTSKVKNIPKIATPYDVDVGDGVQDAFDDMNIGVPARRKARKKSSKKKVTQGQLIAIDLTPSSHVRLSKAVDKADYIKALNKEDPDFKNLWNKYGRGNKPIKKQGKWHWRGKVYEQSKADKARDPRNKKAPTELRNKINKEGTYADYKAGMANMRMIYAPRKDNGNMVPFRIVVPKILVRQEGERLIAKSGSSDSDKMAKLIERLENDFGKLRFKLQPLAVGGYDRYPSYKEAGDKKSPITRVDRGVSRVFQAEGLETPERFGTKAHPSTIRPSGQIIYSAMTKSGQAVEMEVR